MHLFLLRHAEAAPTLPDEFRALTEQGHRQIRDVAGKIDAQVFSQVGVIEHSPLVRARESAGLFRVEAGLPQPLQVCDSIKPDDDPHIIARQLAHGHQDRLLVGHNPHLEVLAGLLLGQGRVTVQVAFRLGALLALERFSPPTALAQYGYWQLRWLEVPQHSDVV